jgi:hypothetical protein
MRRRRRCLVHRPRIARWSRSLSNVLCGRPTESSCHRFTTVHAQGAFGLDNQLPTIAARSTAFFQCAPCHRRAMHAGQTHHITPDRNALREAERARTTVPSTERPMRLVRALLGQWPRRQSLRACCAHLRAVGPFACSGPRVCLFVCLDSSAVCAAGVGHARARRVQVVLEVEGLFRPWPVRTLHYSKLSAGRKRTIDKVKCKRTLGRTLVESGTRETQPQNHVNVAIDCNRVCRRI